MNKLLELIDLSKYNDEPEFKAALVEFFSSLDDEYFINKYHLTAKDIDKIINPEHIIKFDVKWNDDKGVEHINKGYRVQWSSANGPYKGGLRFNPNVNLSVLKCLAFEQTFKNILTGLPMGGGKGGSDFNPIGKSDNEIKTFCRAFMKELWPHIGVDKDIPAGDLGCGAREIETLYLAYKEFSGKSDCSLTGKPIYLGGSLARKEATGFGLCYFANETLKTYRNDSFKGKKVIISGSGNVAMGTLQKAIELGATVVGMSDINNAIYVPDGIDFATMKHLKEDLRADTKEYANLKPNVIVFDNPKDLWSIKCDIAMPCATQFEINEQDAKKLIDNGASAVFEGANMPCTLEATNLILSNGLLFSPGKASNAGGVGTSYLEIVQNVKNEKWSFEEVDQKLSDIMKGIFKNCYETAKKLGDERNLVKGANNYSFDKLLTLLKI